MASTLNSNGEAILTRKSNGSSHIGRAFGHNDESRMLVEGGCPYPARSVVAIVTRQQRISLQL
jgi:hypothetical protein